MRFVQLRGVSARVVTDVNALLNQLKQHPRVVTSAVLKKVLASPDVELWTIHDGEKIIGMATLLFLSISTADFARIEDVVIDKRYRGMGLGAKLIRHLIARARKRRVHFISLSSNPARTAANKLYQKLGFTLHETNSYQMKL